MYLFSRSRRARLAQRVEKADSLRRPCDANGVVRGAEEFTLAGSNGSAALLIHGFNDTPQSMRYLASFLNKSGYTVHVPRLPGHGVPVTEMVKAANRMQWQQAVRSAWQMLSAQHNEVHLFGQSMGGALAVLLTQEVGVVGAVGAVGTVDTVGAAKSLVLLAPYLAWPWRMRLQLLGASVIQMFLPYIKNVGGATSIHDPTERALALGPGLVTAKMLGELRSVAQAAQEALHTLQLPTLYLQSRMDNRIRVTEATRYFEQIGSIDKQLRWLDGCGHIISADYCRRDVAEAGLAWISKQAK